MNAPAAGAVFVHRAGTPSTRAQFDADAARIARQLPPRAHLVNLCDQREPFLLTFAAAMRAGQVQLMPAGRSAGALAELRAQYPDSHSVTDEDVRRWRAAPVPEEGAPRELRSADPDRLVLIGFTSGSTGKSQPHAKHWRALATSAALNSAAIRAAVGLRADAPLSVVGTVPPHHMYGIEMTVLLPLFAGMSVHAERPLFPADVAAALAETAQPRLLVSTPLHLRALAESDVRYPPLALIVSATAPLDPALARQVEAKFGAPLLEMFGSTETCVIATRRTAQHAEWHLHEGVDIEARAESTRVTAGWFAQPQELQDVLEPRGARGFVLLGRNADLVEVAGRRASLADITRRLCAVPGVADAIAFQPDDAAPGVANRVAALVVSRGPDAREIARALATGLDAVFLPRPLLLVDAIPRDAVGKVSRARLLELARSSSAAE